MTPTKFDELVKNRANERVQARIVQFMTLISQGVRDLYANRVYTSGYADYGLACAEVQTILKVLSTPSENRKWPHALWAAEQEAVSKELLGLMDEMQKAFLASQPKPTDEQAAEPVAKTFP